VSAGRLRSNENCPKCRGSHGEVKLCANYRFFTLPKKGRGTRLGLLPARKKLQEREVSQVRGERIYPGSLLLLWSFPRSGETVDHNLRYRRGGDLDTGRHGFVKEANRCQEPKRLSQASAWNAELPTVGWRGRSKFGNW